MMPDVAEVLGRLRSDLPMAVVEQRNNPGPSGQHSLLVGGCSLVDVCRWLRDVGGFDLLTNVSGVDWVDPAKADAVAVPVGEGGEAPASEGFLEVVYHLYATAARVGPLVLRCRTGNRAEQVEVPSVVGVYRSAEFQEREIYDLYGVVFTGHPDLRRILMWDGYADHPMRKDYVAPDDYEYEPTPHDAVLAKARLHYPSAQ